MMANDKETSVSLNEKILLQIIENEKIIGRNNSLNLLAKQGMCLRKNPNSSDNKISEESKLKSEYENISKQKSGIYFSPLIALENNDLNICTRKAEESKFISDFSQSNLEAKDQTHIKTLIGDNTDDSEGKISRDEEETEKGNKEKEFGNDFGCENYTTGFDSTYVEKECDFASESEGEKLALSELHTDMDICNEFTTSDFISDSTADSTMLNNLVEKEPKKRTCISKKISCTSKLETGWLKYCHSVATHRVPTDLDKEVKIKNEIDSKRADKSLLPFKKRSKKIKRTPRKRQSPLEKRRPWRETQDKDISKTFVKRRKQNYRLYRNRCRRRQLFFEIDFWIWIITSHFCKSNFVKKYNGKRNSSQYLQMYNKSQTKGSDNITVNPVSSAFRVRGHSGGDSRSDRSASGNSSNGHSSAGGNQQRREFSPGGRRNGDSGNSGDNGNGGDDPKKPGGLPDKTPASPSLPPPQLDDAHRRMREQAELTISIPPHHLPECGHRDDVPYQDHDGGGADQIAHGALPLNTFCDKLGIATNRIPEITDMPDQLNICLSNALHDLSYASSNVALNDCITCSILSCMLKHLASLTHEPGVKSCDCCSQILHLIVWHVLICMKGEKRRSKVSRCDLCYKIGKTSEWKKEKLISILIKLKAKIKKYCAKVLGSSSDSDDPPGPTSGMSEVDSGITQIEHSTPPSSGLSFTGNPVTQETGQPYDSQVYIGESLFSSSIASASSLPPQETPMAVHSKLTRKPSTKGRSTFPQTIEEESAVELTKSYIAGEANDEPVGNGKDLLLRLSELQYSDSPYDTQKTYGQQPTYVSMPANRDVHDMEQFISTTTSNRILGTPGVGSVVLAHPSQLQIVSIYWAKKREECEKTGVCPYQHREEGVILAEYRDKFSILRNRYQKHQQWQRLTHLGNGMSGKCHLAVDLKTNFRFCCKKIHLLRYSEDELSIWTELSHPFIVKLYGAIRHGVKVYIFSEFIDGGDLAACIEQQKTLGRRLSHWSAINYFKQLLDALAYLQSKNVLHEDVKADNILLRRDTTYIAVTDFGTSRKLQDPKELKNKQPVGSPTHWSPEKASMTGHGFPSDLWAAVCVLVHMLSGSPPWVKRFNKAGILNYIIYTRPPPMDDVPQNVQEGVRKLIEKGFVKDPLMRPSPLQLLQDPAFKILDDERPETYFSTLMSHSVRPSPRQIENTEETHDQMRQLTTTPLNIISDKTVLYEQHISTVGPTQDVQPASQQTLEEVPGDDSALEVPPSIQDEEEAEISTIRNESEEAVESVTSDSDNERPELQARPHIESRISELIEVKDINNLLPDFALICRDDGSENSLSIQKFFVDNFNSTPAVKFGKQASLEVFQPAEKDPKALPNLSIFDNSISSSSSVKSKTEFEESFRAAIVGNKESEFKRTSPVFTFSSDSDCTSSELFEIGPVPDHGQERQPAAVMGASGSESLAISPSMPTNLMQRKKENLKLDLNSTGNPSLVHSISETLPQTSGAEYKSEKRSNTWTKLSSCFTPKPPSQQQTPSTGKSATPSTRPGTSSSTASSFAHPFFSLSKTVSEIQDSEYQDILDNLSYDPGLGAVNADSDIDHKYDTKYVPGTPYMESSNDILHMLTQDYDNKTLEGLKLEFFDSEEKSLFEIRLQETPVYLRHFINTIRNKVAHLYNHFSITLLNGTPFKYNRELTETKYKIVCLKKPGEKCLCDRCSTLHD